MEAWGQVGMRATGKASGPQPAPGPQLSPVEHPVCLPHSLHKAACPTPHGPKAGVGSQVRMRLTSGADLSEQAAAGAESGTVLSTSADDRNQRSERGSEVWGS